MKIATPIRQRMESAKEVLKKTLVDDVCRQMDSLFLGVLTELETTASILTCSPAKAVLIKKSSSSSGSSTDTAPNYTSDSQSSEKANTEPMCDLQAQFESALKDQLGTPRNLEDDFLKRTFKSKTAKERQFKTIHLEDNQIKCPIVWCDQVFYKRHEFVLHFHSVHSTVYSLNCMQCNTVLYRPWDMFMHELLYHNVGLFGCTKEYCTFSATTRAQVLAHYDQVHLGRSPKRPISVPDRAMPPPLTIPTMPMAMPVPQLSVPQLPGPMMPYEGPVDNSSNFFPQPTEPIFCYEANAYNAYSMLPQNENAAAYNPEVYNGGLPMGFDAPMAPPCDSFFFHGS